MGLARIVIRYVFLFARGSDKVWVCANEWCFRNLMWRVRDGNSNALVDVGGREVSKFRDFEGSVGDDVGVVVMWASGAGSDRLTSVLTVLVAAEPRTAGHVERKHVQ